MMEYVKSEDHGVSRRQVIAAAQRQKEKVYWLDKLSGQTEPGVFPYDGEIEVGRYCPDRVFVDLSEEIFLKLKALSSGSDHLLHMVLTAALGVLLKGCAHRDDLVVGTTVLRQAEGVSFINTVLPLRLCVRQHLTFKQLLLQVQETLVEATENQNYPVQLLTDQYPLFGTAILLENLHNRQYLGDIEPDMIFSFLRTGTGMAGQVEYNASLYEKTTVERIAANFKQVLEQVVFNVDLAISEIEILSAEEKQRILYEFNAGEVEYPKEKSVPELFREQAGISPRSAAVVYKERKITYEVLDRASARLAAMLGEMGVKPGVPAAVLLDWSVELIAAIMGILRAGGAYLPIDPRYPGKRIETIVNDSNAFVVVTSTDLAAKIGGFRGQVLELPGVMEEEYGPEETRSLCFCSPHDPAYIIYTSGSTGAPKGIVVEHHSFIDFVCWAVEEFGHRPGYQVLLSNSYASDGSIQQVFPPLVSGGTLHLLDPEVRAHPRDYYAYLKTNRINCIDEVPVVMNLLFDSLDLDETRELLPDLISLSLGSEYVPIEVVRKCRKYLNHNGKIINAYGPAEASVETCTYHFDGRSETEVSLIGKPRRNLRVYILDPQGNCCPIGVPGEICIGGVGLARGYINNPELTAEKFIEYRSYRTNRTYISSKKIYKTGDQGRWLVDGNIEFLGRIDTQVQLRGFRVELGEIENQLLKHEQIKEAVVMEKTDPNGDKCLCAYIVIDKVDVEQLRTFLSGKLPGHMIPAYFMPIEKIPLTPNGKIDRKALPEPGFGIDAGDYVGPGDDIEKKLQDIWSEALALAKEKISIHADFFHLGGHSLKAAVMISRVHEVLHVKVPLAEVFRTPSIKGLSGYIRRQGEERFICIEPVEKREYYVTSAAQKRMYIIQQMNQGIVYNTPDIIALEYEPDVKKLTETFKRLIRRHESLRTSFHMLENRLVQRVHDDVEFEIEYLAAKNAKEREDIVRNFIRPFDSSKPPLFRVGLIKPAEERHILIVDIHHIITDGVSSIILERDFTTLYNDMEETLAPLRIQYADFSQWQNSEKQKEKLNRQEEYWLKELAGDIPLLDLPTDSRRPEVFTFTGDTVLFEIDPEPARLLKQVAKEEGVTLYLVMLTLFYVLLAKLSSQEDIVIGTGIFGRNHADLHHVIGMFLNMIPLRNYPRGHKSFREFLGEVKKRTLEAFENQDLPFDDLLARIQVERQGHATPLFDVVFSLQETELGPEIQAVQANEKTGFKRADYEFNTNTSKFDLTFNGMEKEGKLRMAVEYSTQLFKKERITRMIQYFKKTVTAVLENRDIRLCELDVLPEAEKWELLYEFNRTGTDYPADKTLHQLFEEQAEMRPDRIAVLFGEQQLTFRELNERAARLAGLLQKKGVKPNSVVGMMLERSLDMIIGILAVLKAGGAYLPLEPGTPRKRMLSMLEDCRAPILLTTRAAAAGYSFSTLQGLQSKKISPQRTAVRPQITDLDSLPFPDRSLVDYEKYHRYNGFAMAKHTIPILASRGCPYNCAYCHKIWPKKQIVRSAENVFAEVSRLYDIGVRRFVMLDDIFNLNIKNSSRFYRLITDHCPDLQLFFPGGVRGDILTHEYIDLMIRAGTVNLMMALESASPRIQRLVGKNLDIDRFRENFQYILNQYPGVILEINIMMGFPTETEEEALMSLDFIKQHRWIDFPNLNILKIYAGTDMEHLALNNGISREAIENSFNRAYHELPDTLPFDKNFVRKCQAEFLNGYFLKKERLLAVLPHQMKILSEDEMVRKYDSYLPVEIKSFAGLLEFFGITREDLGITGPGAFQEEHTAAVPGFHEKVKAFSPVDGESHLIVDGTAGSVLRVLLLDLSKTFSTEPPMLYDVTESPLGLMYLLTYLNREFGGKIRGKIAHARMDFDNYRELKALIEEFPPDVIGLRTLTFYKDFYHQTAAAIRQWGVEAPIIAGGPYAGSDWAAVLQDPNIDLAVIGEGELTLAEIIGKMIENRGRLPGEEVLKDIPGIAFIPGKEKTPGRFARQVMMMDLLEETLQTGPAAKVSRTSTSSDPAYVIFTSGSTGKPKGTLTAHYNVVRVVRDTNYIDLQPQDRILQLSNYAFDGSVFDIYGALANGASLVMMTGEQVLNLDRLSHLLKKECITVFFVTTALFNALVDLNIESFAHIRKVLFGGERVSVDHTRRALNALGKGKILHMYGPTETTVYASFYPVDHIWEHRETIPIGGPLANTTIYILDKNLNLVPLGVGGEICIGGRGNAPGYLNNPELTAEKFLVYYRSYRTNRTYIPSQKIYKTGDLGRRLAGGNIEFIGRLDQQVKIRGFRIEPGEIEKYLLQLEVIDQAVVIPGETKDGDRYLCAYVVPAGKRRRDADPDELKTLLSHDLPDYMVPAHFVILDKIPLTSNGKVDRRRLPDPEVPDQDAAYAAPGNPVEEKLVRIWSEILGIKKEIIGIDNDFFQLGGHSLRATILISRIHKEFQVEIPMAELFKSPFIRELAASIKNSTRAGFSPIEPAEKKEYYKLSPAQERLYVLQQMVQDNVVYNVPHAVEIAGPPDTENLAAAFKKLLNRHESLRTSFHMVGKEPVQRIHTQVELEIEYFSAEQRAEAAIQDFIRSFDLSLAPLLRLGLIHTPGDKHILMVDMHHIITDGTSMPLFINESLALYAREELPPLRLQYKDFAAWQHQEEQVNVIRRQESYWLRQFAGEIPVLNLPLDYPRPPVQDFAGAVVEFGLSPEQGLKLNEAAAAQGATLYMVLLAVTTILFYKLTHQEDIVIGTPVAGRRHVDLERIVGMFVNTLAMRNYPAGDQTFSRFLDQVKENTLQAFENQEYPFEELVGKVVVSRDASRSPLFDTVFALQNMEMQTPGIPEAGIGDLGIKPYEMESTISKFDLTLACSEVEHGLLCGFEYCTALFHRDTIERFSAYYRRIISAVVNQPGIRLKQIEIISEEEKRHLLIDFNDTGAEYPQNKTIHELFAEQVERTPGSTALVGNVSVTYAELNRKSNQLAHALKEKGVLADSIVGIKMEPSVEMIIGILGIMKSGGAYLPIDPEYPPERIDYMLKDSNAALQLTARELLDVCRGTAWGAAHPAHKGAPTNLAYIIYTSGTTGRPKGVMIEHRSLINLCTWHNRYYAVTGKDHASQYASFSFDASVWEIFPYLISGAALYIIHRDIKTDIRRLNRFFEKNDITVAFLPTQVCEQFITQENRSLRLLLTGGDKLRTYKKRNYRLVNNYGPTENTVVTTGFVVERDYANIPIGKPVNNTSLYILNKYHQLQPLMVPGELCISSTGLSRGYLNNPELTAETFLVYYRSYRTNRTYIPSQKIYKTGDLARWLPDGNIEFLGRIDQQVKIRGFRIEPGEIQYQLMNREVAQLSDSCVMVREDPTGERFLCAYFAADREIDAGKLREYLKTKLPAYMVPAHFIQLERMPMTPNGKIDWKALPAPGLQGGRDYIAPGTESEKKLAALWAELLGISSMSIGIDDDFFQLGGNSLKAAALMWKIQDRFNVDIPLVELFSAPTVKELAQFIERQGSVPHDRPVLLTPRPGETSDPGNARQLFLIHDGTGEVDGYIEFCNHLSSAGEFNAWGIRAQKIENHTPRNVSVEELAEEYIQKIKSLQPHGPYYIAGWSIGGTIAFEIARQLEHQEKNIAFLALIDTMPPNPEQAQTIKGAAGAFSLESETRWLKKHLPKGRLNEQLRRLKDLDTLWRTVGEHLEAVDPGGNSIRALLPANLLQMIPHSTHLPVKQLIYYLNVIRTMERACALYIPKNKVKTKLHYFAAQQSGGIVDKERWQESCKNKVEFYELQGDHFSILQNPNVSGIASLAVDRINKSG